MSKFQIIITVIIIGVFATLFYVAQQYTAQTQTPAKNIPSLPPLPGTNDYSDVNLTPKTAPKTAQQQQAEQQTQPTVGVLEPVAASVSATIRTSRGNIDVTLFGDVAPNTVRNFMEKARSGFYTNLTFHRVEDWVIQGGDPNGNGTGGGQMLTEPNDKPFVTGSLGVARGSNPQISNDAQFFITKSDADQLNNQYTNFGIVTDGMDVVNKIKVGDKILGITIQK